MTAIIEEAVDSAAIASASSKRKPLWQLAIRNPAVIFGGAILLIMVAIAILAPFLGTVDPVGEEARLPKHFVTQIASNWIRGTMQATRCID